MITQHITDMTVTSVRRIGSIPKAWVTVATGDDRWAMSGTFIDLLMFAERLVAAIDDEMPEADRLRLVECDRCTDDDCPCQEGAA